EGGVGDLVVGDVVDLQSAGIGVAQQHVAFATAAKVADARELPVQADRAQEGGVGDLIVVDVVGLQSAGIGIAQEQSLSPRPLKLPTPENCQFKPTVPRNAALVMLLL